MTASQVIVAPFLLSRVSGVSPWALDALRLDRTLVALEEASHAEAEMHDHAPVLADSLFACVPGLDHNARLRRAVLALKRNVHNARLPAPDPSLDEIEQLLSDDVRAALSAWIAATRRREDALERGRMALPDEIEQAGAALINVLSVPDVQCGLAMATPDFLRTLLRTKGDAARPDSRFARSCLSYASRTAMKTSPFSTLTRVGLGRFDSAEPSKGREVVYLTRALATALLAACARDTRLSGTFVYEPNASLRQVGETWLMLAPEYQCMDGFFWRQERCVNLGAYNHLVRTVVGLGRCSYEACLAALGEAGGHGTFARLLATHILRPVAPWEQSDPNPLLSLARAVAKQAGPFPQQVAEHLNELAATVAAIADSSTARRLALLADLEGKSASGFQLLGQVAPSWLAEGSLVYEDAGATHTIPALGEYVQADLEKLGGLMRPHFLRTSVYDHLVEHFISRFGPGQECHDVVGFLYSFLARPDANALMSQSMHEDLTRLARGDAGTSCPPVGMGTTPPSSTVFFQLAAHSHKDVLRGDYRLVVNQYNPGLGGLLARFLPLFAGESSALASELSTWLCNMHPEALPVDLPVAADWNSLQHRGLGLFPTLQWPGEAPTLGEANGIDMRSLRLIHDRHADTLSLRLPDGSAIAPTYLGVIPPYFLSGPLRLLFVLIDPWLNGHRVGWSPRLSDPPAVAPTVVEYFPRQTDGRIVLQRARWRVPVQEFPLQAPGEDAFAYFGRVQRWRQHWQIPQEVFITPERPRLALEAKKRKPVWVRFDSLHTLAGCRQLVAEDVLALSVVEALPGRDDHWLMGDDGLPRAAEFLALLRWPAVASESYSAVVQTARAVR